MSIPILISMIIQSAHTVVNPHIRRLSSAEDRLPNDRSRATKIGLNAARSDTFEIKIIMTAPLLHHNFRVEKQAVKRLSDNLRDL